MAFSSIFRRMGTKPTKVKFIIAVEAANLPIMRGISEGDLVHVTFERGAKSVSTKEYEIEENTPYVDMVALINEELTMDVTLYRDSSGELQEKTGTLTLKQRKSGSSAQKGKDAFKTIGVVPLDLHDLVDSDAEEMSLPLAWCSGEGATLDVVVTVRQRDSAHDDDDNSTITSSSTMKGRLFHDYTPSPAHSISSDITRSRMVPLGSARKGNSDTDPSKVVKKGSGYKGEDDDDDEPTYQQKTVQSEEEEEERKAVDMKAKKKAKKADKKEKEKSNEKDSVGEGIKKKKKSSKKEKESVSKDKRANGRTTLVHDEDETFGEADDKYDETQLSSFRKNKNAMRSQEYDGNEDSENFGRNPVPASSDQPPPSLSEPSPISSVEKKVRRKLAASAGVDAIMARQKEASSFSDSRAMAAPAPAEVAYSALSAAWRDETKSLETKSAALREKAENLEVMTAKAEFFANEASRLDSLLAKLREEKARLELDKEETEQRMQVMQAENEALLSELINTKMAVVNMSTELDVVKKKCSLLKTKVASFASQMSAAEVAAAIGSGKSPAPVPPIRGPKSDPNPRSYAAAPSTAGRPQPQFVPTPSPTAAIKKPSDPFDVSAPQALTAPAAIRASQERARLPPAPMVVAGDRQSSSSGFSVANSSAGGAGPVVRRDISSSSAAAVAVQIQAERQQQRRAAVGAPPTRPRPTLTYTDYDVDLR